MKKKIPLVLALFVIVMCGCSHYEKSSSPKIPRSRYDIMSKGQATEKMMFDYFKHRNQKINSRKLMYIVKTYILESEYEGVNHDVVFTQMCHETNFLKFGGSVDWRQNNFCGLGSLEYDISGACFFTIKDGIRAHVQHLKAYGSELPLKNECLDPRFGLIIRGTAKNVKDLTGRWATDNNYGAALVKKINDLLSM